MWQILLSDNFSLHPIPYLSRIFICGDTTTVTNYADPENKCIGKTYFAEQGHVPPNNFLSGGVWHAN